MEYFPDAWQTEAQPVKPSQSGSVRENPFVQVFALLLMRKCCPVAMKPPPLQHPRCDRRSSPAPFLFMSQLGPCCSSCLVPLKGSSSAWTMWRSALSDSGGISRPPISAIQVLLISRLNDGRRDVQGWAFKQQKQMKSRIHFFFSPPPKKKNVHVILTTN